MTSPGDVNLSLSAFSTFLVFEVCNYIRSGVTGFRLVDFFLSPKTESKIVGFEMNLDAPLNCEATTLVSVFVLEEKEVELSRFCF